MIVKELINNLLEYPMDSEVYTQRAYRNNSYVYVKASDVFEEISGKVVITDHYDTYEFIRLEDENENLREENQKLRELLFDPRRVTNGGLDES